MTPSTTNTAARELLASALDECSRPTDAAEVREGRNPFVRGEYALAAIEKAITQQQGGEQEARELLALECGFDPDSCGKFEGAVVSEAGALRAIAAAPSPSAALQAGVGRFVACRCVSERDRELCMTKDECSKVYAYSDTAPKEPTK